MYNNISKVSRNKYLLSQLSSIEKEVEIMSKAFYNLENDKFLDFTSDEILKKWETFFGLNLDIDLTREERVLRILYTKFAKDTFTINRVKEQAIKLGGFEVEIEEYYGAYAFHLKLLGVIGVEREAVFFFEFIDTNKPAHLAYDVSSNAELDLTTHNNNQIYEHNYTKSINNDWR